MSDRCVAQLTESLGQYADRKWILEGAGRKKANFDDFVLSGGDLIVIFPQYQVAPGAAGILEAKIPLSSVAGLLPVKYRSK